MNDVDFHPYFEGGWVIYRWKSKQYDFTLQSALHAKQIEGKTANHIGMQCLPRCIKYILLLIVYRV